MIEAREKTKANITAFFDEMGEPDLLGKVLEPINVRFGKNPVIYPDCIPKRLDNPPRVHIALQTPRNPHHSASRAGFAKPTGRKHSNP